MPRPERNLTLTDDEVKVWIQRLHDSEKFVKELRDQTAPYRAAYAGDFPMPFPDEEEGEQVYVNRVHRVVTQWTAAVYAQKPQIRLKAPPTTGGEQREKAEEQQAEINLELRRIKLEDPLDDALHNAMNDGWGWIKSGFHAEYELEVEEIEEVVTDAEAENYAYENYGPEQFPHDVLLGEDHEEHLPQHLTLMQELGAKLSEIMQVVQEAQMMGNPVDPRIMQEVQRLQTAGQALQEHIDLHESRRRERDRKGENETNTRIRQEATWADCPHNSNIVWDLHATGTHDWRWVAERFIIPMDVAKKRFPRKDIVADWSKPKPGSSEAVETEGEVSGQVGGGVNSEFIGSKGGKGDDHPDNLVRYWKIWDIAHRRVIYLQETTDKPALAVKPWPYKKLKTAPHRMLILERDRDEFKPISVVKYIWRQQLELNRYRTKMGMQARRNSRQAIAHPNLPEDFISEVQDGVDGSIHQPEGMTGIDDMRKMFAPIEWGGIHMDVMQAADIADLDIRMDTGLNEAISGGNSRTATEAQIKDSRLGILVDDMLKAVKKIVVEVTEDQRGLMQQFYTQERYGEMFVGGVKQPLTWKGEDLLDFDVEADLGGSEQEKAEIERMQFTEFFKTVAGIPGINLQYLVNLLAKKYDVDPQELWTQAQAAQQQQAQMMAQGGVEGPGRGQNQQQLPNKVNGPRGAAVAQPAMDLSK
jgi:hypothetical protein